MKGPIRLCLHACFVLPIYAAAVAAQAQQIAVGTNAHVSRDRPSLEHGEMVVCAHPTNPNVLIAASMAGAKGLPINSYGSDTSELVYWSADGGNTWHYSMDTFGAGYKSPDPTCAFAPDGSVHFGTMMALKGAEEYHDVDYRLLDYRSIDGGRTWEKPVEVAGSSGADRQYSIFDRTGGRYHGRYYYTWFGRWRRTTQSELPTGGVMALSRSLDGGKHWDLPTTREAKSGIHNGNLVVTSDGTVVGVIGHRRDELPEVPLPRGLRRPFGVVEVLTSTDGGEYITPATRVADFFITQGSVGRIHYINAIAVDASSAYKDRLYVVWNDDRSGRMQALLSYSTDKGRTWTNPRPVDDAGPFDAKDLSKGPHAQGPWVSVNKDGVVGVAWLDRRDAKSNVGYHLRFSASLDGGETWLPSVRVSEQAMTPRATWRVAPYSYTDKPDPDTLSFGLGWHEWEQNGGDCIGMDVDATGGFHPIWADARTGVQQLWSARITVSGNVKAGRQLAGPPLVPVTKAFALELDAKSYVLSEDEGTVSVEARLVNRGSDTLRGPVVARVVRLSTLLARDVRTENSDNEQSSVGAVWDFSSLLPNGELVAGACTGPKRLVFRLIERLPLTPAIMSTTSFVDVGVEILGTERTARNPDKR